MLQDIDWAGLSRLDEIGIPMAVGSTLDDHGGAGVATRRLLTVPPGQCFIATSVQLVGWQGDNSAAIDSPPLATRPALGLIIGDQTAVASGTIQAMPFYRWQALFNASAADTWRTAPPMSFLNWKPKTPICIPSGWYLNNAQPAALSNGSFVRGYLIDERSAAVMGFDTNTDRTTRRVGVASAMATNSAVALVPARTGKSVQILDMFVRVQPQATAAANILTIRQSGDNKVIFQFVNDNPANLQEASLSPGIFTKAGQGISILATTTGVASVTIHYRYVDAEDVPANHWWSQINPTKPGTGATAVGALGRQASTVFAPYYPAKDITVASGLAGPANQHVLKGYVTTAARGTTGDGAWFRVGTGATGGVIGYSIGGIANVGTPVSIAQVLYNPEQTSWTVEQDLAVKTKANEAFWFEAMCALATTADASVRNWSSTAWGLTVPAIDSVGTRVRGTAT